MYYLKSQSSLVLPQVCKRFGESRDVTSSFRMGGCENYGPFWGTLNTRCRILIGIQKGTIILTATHVVSDLLERGSPIQSLHVRKTRFTYNV